MIPLNQAVRKYVLAYEQRPRPIGAKSKSKPAPQIKYTTADYDEVYKTLKNELEKTDKGLGDVSKRILSNRDRKEEHNLVRAYLKLWSCNRTEAIKHLNKISPNPEYTNG